MFVGRGWFNGSILALALSGCDSPGHGIDHHRLYAPHMYKAMRSHRISERCLGSLTSRRDNPYWNSLECHDACLCHPGSSVSHAAPLKLFPLARHTKNERCKQATGLYTGAVDVAWCSKASCEPCRCSTNFTAMTGRHLGSVIFCSTYASSNVNEVQLTELIDNEVQRDALHEHLSCTAPTQNILPLPPIQPKTYNCRPCQACPRVSPPIQPKVDQKRSWVHTTFLALSHLGELR